MKKEYQEVISEYLGVEPIEINSALVSAQNRKRLYWTNIPGIKQPKDEGLMLKDILDYSVEGKLSFKEMNYMKSESGVSFNGGKTRLETRSKMEHEKSSCITANCYKGVPHRVIGIKKICNVNPSGRGMNGNVFSTEGKCPTLTTNKGEGIKVTVNCVTYRKLTPIECERLQTVPDNYTNHVSNSQRFKMLGNGWTVKVIMHFLKNMKF